MADLGKIRAKVISALIPRYVQAFKDEAPIEQWRMVMDALRDASLNDKQAFIDKVAETDRNGIGSAFINRIMRPYLRAKAAVEADEKLADGSISLDEYERIHG